MKTIGFSEAVDSALGQAMAADPRIILIGEDIHGLRSELYIRFGPTRVRSAPISEAAFVGASVAAAMAGLRPVVDILLVDFVGPPMDALFNHAAKLKTFSGGRWQAPLVVRAACGGGYGDGGQHSQSLWGWLAHIPGLVVVVPSNPVDAAGLMLAALEYGGPVIFLEHKLFGGALLESLGRGGRKTVSFYTPSAGAAAAARKTWQPVPIGKAAVRRSGSDLTLVSVGVGVHLALEAANQLQKQGLLPGVIDLRTISPLDIEAVRAEVARSGRMLVVDEDYEAFGLSGELAAGVLDAGLICQYARVCTRGNLPYARQLEIRALPSVESILAAAHDLLSRQMNPKSG